jgi:hypothetical protein
LIQFDLTPQLLCTNPARRLRTLSELKELSVMQKVDWEAVLEKNVTPIFTPPVGLISAYVLSLRQEGVVPM